MDSVDSTLHIEQKFLKKHYILWGNDLGVWIMLLLEPILLIVQHCSLVAAWWCVSYVMQISLIWRESQTFLWKQKAKKAVWWWCTMALKPEKSTFIWLCTQHMLFFLILSTVILPGFVVLLEKGLKIPNTFVQMALAQEAWLYLRSHEKKLLDPKKRDAVPSFSE